MGTFLTLTYAGTEKSLADWGFDQDSAEMLQSNIGMDVFTLAMPGVNIYADPIIPFEGQVTIQSGRTFSLGAYSGGVIEFQGKRLMALLDGRPEYEGVVYQFGGPWYDIDQTAYQQTVYYWVGPLPTDTASYLVSDLVLFQKVTAPGVTVARNTGQQIQDILQHVLDQYSAQSMAAPFQIGTIDPAIAVPTYQVKDIKCSEAIQNCLRCSPDAVVCFDYTFSPPKANVRQRASMTPVSIALADGVIHESLRIAPRYDLQARSVVLYFKVTNTINGNVLLETTKQKYPLAGVEGGLRVLVQTIDLAGWTINQLNGSLTCTARANTAAFWSKYLPELASGKITGFTVGAMTVLDESGTDITATAPPNVLDDGSSIAPWMQISGTPVTGTRVRITATASYTQNDAQGRPMEVFPAKELVARVTLTNGVTGNYSTRASAIEGEGIPAGLAQAVYTALNTLQFDGEVTLAQTEILGMPTVGNVLNLTGGRTEWTTMNAQIQSVRRQWGTGRTEISIGPARHLSAGDLTELFLFNRFRRVWVNPSAQATAQLNSSGSLTLGSNAPKENTQTGLPERSKMAIASALGLTTGATMILHDAANKQITMMDVDSTGTILGTSSAVKMKLADLMPDGTARTASFILFRFKDSADSCNPKKMYIFGTPPEPDP